MSVKPLNHNTKFLESGGEMGERILAKDWSKSALGPIEEWPANLRMMLGVILHSKFPMFIWWSHDLLCFYNDAYRPSLGENGKHPEILGMKGEEAWSEIWSIVKPLIDDVLLNGNSIWNEDTLIPIFRNGKIEDVYWTFGYSPIFNENGSIDGVLVTCTETTEKVLNYKKIEESNNELEFAIAAADMATWDYNPLTGKFKSNNKLKEWFGLPEKTEIELDDAIAIISENDRQRVIDAIQRSLEYSSGGNYESEYSIIHSITKRERIVRAKGKTWFDENNVAYRFNGILQDITENSLTHRKIEENERRLRLMILKAPISIAILRGPEHIIEIANERILEIWDRKEEEAVGKSVLDVLYELKDQGIKELLDNVYNTGILFSATEHQLELVRNGKLQTVYVNFVYEPLYNIDNIVDGVMVVAFEVTDQVISRQKVEQSEERIKTLVANAPFPIGVYIGKEMRIELANQSIIDIWAKGNDVIGKLYTDILPELQNQKIFEQIRSVFETGKPFHAQNQQVDLVLNNQLQPFYFNYSFTPLLDASGNVYGVMNTAADLTDLNIATQRVEESEKRFRNIADNAPVLIWMTGTDMLCNFFNKAWLQFTGRNIEDELGYGWMESMHPDDVKRSVDIFKNAFEKREEFYMEYRLKRADGEYRWLSNRGIPRITHENIFEGYIGACMDIHVNTVYIKEITDSEQKLNIVIDASELGIWELNLETSEITYSKKHREIFGYKEDVQLTHEQLKKHLHPDDVPIRNKAIEHAYETGILFYEARIIWNDGSIHWIEGKGKMFYDVNNKPLKMIGTVLDITERKQVENELSETAKNLQFALEAGRLGSYQLILATGEINCTVQCKENIGLSAGSEFNYGILLELILPEDREAWLQALQVSIETNTVFSHQYRVVWSDGTVHWSHAYGLPGYDQVGNPVTMTGVSVEITKQKLFEQELEKEVLERTKELGQKNDELERMNKELQSFAYISSHDLQEPLRKIQTFSSRIIDKEYQNLSDGGKDYFNRMQESARRMQVLIDDLLAYSRTNTEDRNFEKTDLQKIIEEVKEDLVLEIQQKNAIIEIGPMCDVHIIPFQFRQLMQNLITNSLKFSKADEHPYIKISCETVDGDAVNNHKFIATKYCHITVKDNGIGFEPEYNEKIFEVFQRLHAKQQYKGTGIGLAIVKKIIENHNGIITAKGELNIGATFDIYIPVVQ